MQKSSCAWNTDAIMPRRLNWIIKKIILYICVAGLCSKTPTGRENCSLISIILSNFPRNVNYCYCCYQQRQQRRLAIMTSKRSKWNNSLGELSIIIHGEISVNHCWKCNKRRLDTLVTFTTCFHMGNNVLDFLFAFQHTKPFQKVSPNVSSPFNIHWKAMTPCVYTLCVGFSGYLYAFF